MRSVEEIAVGGNREYNLMRTDLFKERLEAGTQLWVLAYTPWLRKSWKCYSDFLRRVQCPG